MHTSLPRRIIVRSFPGNRSGYGQRGTLPPLSPINLESLRIDQLRQAIRHNMVSFPSPVPTFKHHDRADLQWKLVQLYFVLGWSCEAIAARYNLIHQRVRQILKTWKQRALQTGYIQYIPSSEPIVLAAQTARPGFDFVPLPMPAQPHPVLTQVAAASMTVHSHS